MREFCRTFVRRLVFLFRSRRLEEDLDKELRSHLAVALGLRRLLGNLVYRVSPGDPLAFGAALAVMTVAAACFLPAWRATRTDSGTGVAGTVFYF
jgi:hypothetical protein